MKRLPYIILALAFAVAVVVVIINVTEFKEVSRPYPPTRAALHDRFLALERSLTPLPGTMRYADADMFVPHQCLVLISDAADLPTFFDTPEKLALWVAEGGRLVVECRKPYSDDDEDYEEESSQSETTTDSIQQEPILPEHPLFYNLQPTFSDHGELFDYEAHVLVQQTRLTPGITEPWSFHTGYNAEFPAVSNDKDTVVYRAKGKKLAVIRHWGKGMVLVTGTIYALENQGLKNANNQVLANYLFGPLYDKTGVAWIPAPPEETTPAKTIDSTPVWLSVLFLCLMFFWMAAPRLGPTIPETMPQRRSLRERFIAEGRFLWKHKAAGRLIDPANPEKNYSREAFTASVDQIVQSPKPGETIHHDH